MDPQSHPLLHFFIRMKPKPTSTNVFLQIAKNMEVTRRKIWAVRRCSSVFPSQISEAYPSPDCSMETGVIMQKDESVQKASQSVLILRRVAAPSVTKKRTTPLCSSSLATISRIAPLQRNKEKLCGPVHVSYPTNGSIDT